MKPYLIGIAGPSGAGKSEFCRLMQQSFKGVTRLKLDDFFVDINDIPRKGAWLDWDRPDAIKWQELLLAAKALKQNSSAIVPNYSRKDDCTIGEKCVFPSEIVLVDGFMTLYHPELRSLLDTSIFFRLSEDSQIKRRKERQPWVEDGYLQNVMLPASRTYILPSSQYADFIVNAELSKTDVAKRCLLFLEQKLKNPKQSPTPLLKSVTTYETARL